MEMNMETWQFVCGVGLGLAAGVAIGVNLWHIISLKRGWYREDWAGSLENNMKMKKQDIRNKVVEKLADLFGITPSFVKDDTLIENLGLDSIDKCEFVSELEEDFGITVPDEDCWEAKTVGEIVEIVYEQVKEVTP